MQKYLDNFWTDLYKKVGFKKSLFVVLLFLIIPMVISVYFNYLSNSKMESFKNDLTISLENYKSELENLKKKDFELFIYKKNIYTDVIKVVDKKFDSMKYKGGRPISEEPTTQEMNEVYRQLLLVTDNEDIPAMFMNFMDAQKDYCSPAKRGKFLMLLRTDLGKSGLIMNIDSIPYYRIFVK